MLQKIWTIAWKDISTTFGDRNLVLVMLAAPLAVATIIALAFGGVAGGDAPVSNIPIAIVNLDSGSERTNLGEIYVSAFIPSEATSSSTASTCDLVDSTVTSEKSAATLQDLTDATLVADVETARKGVDDGTYTAAIIIPENFTQKVSYGQDKPVEAASVEVYANGGRTISAGIIRSIAESITNQIATGNIAVAATIDSLIARAQADPAFSVQFLAASASGSFNPDFSCAFVPGVSRLTIDQQSVEGKKSNGAATLLVIFGSAQAMFFSLFTGQGGVGSIFDERRQWTLQRLVVSPTPRLAILVGKMLGVFFNCVLQLVFLFIALTVVASLLNGSFNMIWGTDFLRIGLTILLAALAATGLGTLLAGVAKTPEQGQIYGSLISVAMAVLGGAFGFQLPREISQFSLLYWGTDAFTKLANGQGDITLNLLVLAVFGVGMFGIGFWLFNRRLDI
ncbi:MAG: ABC transporter permease [Anaerolineae bacterium]